MYTLENHRKSKKKLVQYRKLKIIVTVNFEHPVYTFPKKIMKENFDRAYARHLNSAA